MTPFKDRRTAGYALARALDGQQADSAALVLALPRGGVPVAASIADALNAQLDVINVRKLGVPWQPELAMGALAENGARYFNNSLIQSLGISSQQINHIIDRETTTLQRRARLFRGDRPLPEINGRSVILVDDGLATGATMEVAIQALRAMHPNDIMVALPVGPRGTAQHLAAMANRCVCLLEPTAFQAVGNWYLDFTQVSDEEVIKLLSEAHARHCAEHRFKTSNNRNNSTGY